ncbi:MAG: DUF3833 family protein [Cypionkella sp.]|jgi:hypothetical protein
MIWGALILLLVGAVIALLAQRFVGFGSERVADWAGKGPAFDPRLHLAGPLLCEGVIYGPFGRVSSRFVAEMQGEWQGNRGVLRERFTYDSGEVQERAWQLTLGNDGAVRAEAGDVVGAAAGVVAGPALRLLYDLRLPSAQGGHVLRVVDWMYLAPNGTILNRSQFRKFGFKVAELVATMRRIPA